MTSRHIEGAYDPKPHIPHALDLLYFRVFYFVLSVLDKYNFEYCYWRDTIYIRLLVIDFRMLSL